MKNMFLPVNIPAIEFARRLSSCKKISAVRIFLLLVYFTKLLAVIPAAFLQFLFYNKRINKTVIAQPPIFILGHYRSGTTYLQKLMCADPQFGFINNYDIICPNSSLLFGKWLQNCLQVIINRFHIKTSFYNNTISNLNDPAEEERFLINKGSAYTDYWRFIFPLCWNKWQSCSQLLKDPDYSMHWKKEYMYLLKMIAFKNTGKQLVLKSPPNTERIKYLLEIFPGAKFIYISRNPYHVFYSTCNMWKKAIKKFWLQNISEKQIEEIVFTEYANLLEQYEKDKKLIPAPNLIEVQYEDLEQYPLNVLEEIYMQLKLPDFISAKQNFINKIQQEDKYKTFEYIYSRNTFNEIEARWNKYIEQWNKKNSEVFINEYAN
jgi:hypothetical protein